MEDLKNRKLTHTLQTYLGMVKCQGAPLQRSHVVLPQDPLNDIRIAVQARDPSSLTEEDLVSLFTDCVLHRLLPEFENNSRQSPNIRCFQSNVRVCYDRFFDIEFMKTNIRMLNRVDLEQAAAVVISAIGNDPSITERSEIVSVLIRELAPFLLTHSCMWLEEHQRHPKAPINEGKLSRLISLTKRMSNKSYSSAIDFEFDSPTAIIRDWSNLLPLLLRVRRCSPRTRCLLIPQWIFDAAGINAPPAYASAVQDTKIDLTPGHEPTVATTALSDEDIVLSRKAFRALQRRLLHYYRFWDPAIRLRKAITDFEANVIYSAEHIKSSVLPSRDTLTVAHYFLALQRRLQRKLVSDLGWTRFLEKGEGAKVFQNNPDIQSTFEQRLGEFSGQSGVPITGDVVVQIDRCCLLMEEYVRVYGKGDGQNLVFVRGRRGGSGRGAVDEYNLLCDIMRMLCQAAKTKGLAHPGAVRKFLAKDIMAWNQSFGDDAFADGVVPGWETWLAERRETGIVTGLEGL
ncbi:MAG: hypothetical protein L6R40_006316 [Gallowayella cf. fulva]|nr:MAG: hypothetical protein L6R40_006316 [Xanthomendoza cf. fulva]